VQPRCTTTIKAARITPIKANTKPTKASTIIKATRTTPIEAIKKPITIRVGKTKLKVDKFRLKVGKTRLEVGKFRLKVGKTKPEVRFRVPFVGRSPREGKTIPKAFAKAFADSFVTREHNFKSTKARNFRSTKAHS
jgi:hypothetical protein